MRPKFLSRLSRPQADALPLILADPERAKACAACARHDEAALIISGLRHSYCGEAAAVEELSLCLHPGEIVSLVGPSGCGKTTTLRLVAGLEQLQTGLIQVGDRLASAPGRHLPAEDRNVGMMFQDYALFPHLSVRANVAFGLAQFSARERRDRVEAALEDVGLSSMADRMPSTLSGGPWRARSRPGRKSSSWMSRSRAWTRSSAARCAATPSN